MIKDLIKEAVEQQVKELVKSEVQKVLAGEPEARYEQFVKVPPRVWLKIRLHEKGASQRQLGRHLKLDPGSMCRTVDGKRRLALDEVIPMAEFLNVPIEEVVLAFSK